MSPPDPEQGVPCPRCLLRARWCLCPVVPSVPNTTPVLILRHVKERLRVSNSARAAALALARCTIVEVGAPEGRLDPEVLFAPGTALLYPGSGAPWEGPQPPAQLLVLDGSWSQVRALVRRWPALSRLPRLALAPPERSPAQRMRRQHREDGLSTLEAVALALGQLEGPERSEPLLALYDALAERVWASRGGYRAPGGSSGL